MRVSNRLLIEHAKEKIMKSQSLVIPVLLLVLMPLSASPVFRSTEGISIGSEYDESDGGTLIATIGIPAGWAKAWGLAYHDEHDMLYTSQGRSSPNNALVYASYSGGETVTWVEFDYADYITGLGCYEDDLLFGITQSDPLNPRPYYLYTWQLDASGIPMLPPDVYQMTTLSTGGMGGCEWDGDYLWMVDQNLVVDDPPIIYKYDVGTHQVVDSWSFNRVGAFGIACVWDAGILKIWVSEYWNANQLVEHSSTGGLTGPAYNLFGVSPNDIAYKYDTDFDGPGFFVCDYNTSTIRLYDHNLTNLEHDTWGSIKAGFIE